MNYYERHIGDYLRDTAHLSLLEHGIYSRLLDIYYTRESAIPADKVMRLLGCRSDAEESAARDVLTEFFELEDGAYQHKRCERELAKFYEKSAKARESAGARWSKKDANAMRTQCERIANAMPTQCEGNATHTPHTRHQTPDTSKYTHTQPLSATDGGRVCGLMRAAGLTDGNPGHPDLLALIAAGATDAEFSGAATAAVGKGKGFAYAVGMLKRQRTDAAAAKYHVGPLPAGPPDRKTVQLQTAALMTGATRKQTTEIIDVTPRIITA